MCGPCALTVDFNDAGNLGAALQGLMDAPDQRADLARAGRKRVEALFDIRMVARQMDDFLDHCLGLRGGQALEAPVAFPPRNR